MQIPKYKVKYSGDTFVGNSIEEVARNISKQYGIAFTTAVLHVNKNIIPVSVNRIQKEFNPKPKKKLTLENIINGAKAVMHNISGNIVDQPTINLRASICSSCPKKSEVALCVSCGAAKKIVRFANFCKSLFVSPTYTIPNSLERNYCDVCDCALAVMLPAASTDFSLATKNDPERPSACWIKKGL